MEIIIIASKKKRNINTEIVVETCLKWETETKTGISKGSQKCKWYKMLSSKGTIKRFYKTVKGNG